MSTILSAHSTGAEKPPRPTGLATLTAVDVEDMAGDEGGFL
jgi:hypothetical protein